MWREKAQPPSAPPSTAPANPRAARGFAGAVQGGALGGWAFSRHIRVARRSVRADDGPQLRGREDGGRGRLQPFRPPAAARARLPRRPARRQRPGPPGEGAVRGGVGPSGAGPSPAISALLVDLYELTMAQSYVDERMEDEAVFSLFVRRLPPERGYLVAAGLDDA